MKEKFSGNLKEIILYMINNETDCCEVTNTVGDISVTVDITITKITDGDKVIYDAEEVNDDIELVQFDNDDIGYLS